MPKKTATARSERGPIVAALENAFQPAELFFIADNRFKEVAVSRRSSASLPNRCPARRVTQRAKAPALPGILNAKAYSVRNAVIGVTRIARRAGRKQASNAAEPSITLEASNATGSLGLT